MVIVSVDYRLSPEFVYPIPTNDCFDVTKYVLKNPSEFDADSNRVIIGGDSAGGNAVTVVMMRLIKEKQLTLPKLQVLIYPSLQKIFTRLPSQIRYSSTGILGPAKFTFSKFASWYLGIAHVTDDVENVFRNHDIFGLIENEAERNFILECLDARRIPDKYRPDASYYQDSAKFDDIPKRVAETSLLKRDPKMAELFLKVFEPEFSPLITPKEILARLPKTYLLVLEWDTLKDEAILYAERLKEAGVNVHVSFFENAFHGIAGMIQSDVGYKIARDMQIDTINYLKDNL